MTKTRNKTSTAGVAIRPGAASLANCGSVTWNLRLELRHLLAPEPLRTTDFASALPSQNEHEPKRPASPTASAPASVYVPLASATSLKAVRFHGTSFPLQLEGTLDEASSGIWDAYESGLGIPVRDGYKEI